MSLAAGTHLGSYEILSPLGAGGMGEVYRARDLRLDRQVAVKVLPEGLAADSVARQRFKREARLVATLSHPNILAIHDFGHSDGVAYAVMELLEGETLRQRLRSVRLSSRKAVQLALPIARALAAAHDRGIVHRDLKPDNVFLTTDGQVKVLDFGLAKLAEPAGEPEPEAATLSQQTTPGVVMGTVGYMSPEQVRGWEVDHRTDIFAVGAVLYEMLAGRRAFARDSTADTMSAILKEEPPELSGEVTGVSPILDRILRRCLEKKPAERFQSAHDLAFTLEIVAGLEVAGDSDPASARPSPETEDQKPSIAVLPFINMSADPEQVYFCEGMAEEILNALTRLEGLRVAARSSAFRFKEEGRDIRQVGEALKVKTVLEGSVRSSGKRLRVTTQLVNVEDGYHIWSERYDRQMEDVFAIQDEITESVVEALRGKLVAAAPATRDRDQPPNLEAYHLYLKGQHHWFRRDKDSLAKAARFFEQAAELDPSYVLAHVGVANAYSSLGFYGARHAAVTAKAHVAIERALSLGEDRPEVRAGLGLMHLWLDWDYAGAEREFRRALEQRPDLVLVRCWCGFLLYALRRYEESLDCVGTALEQDPLSVYAQMSVGLCSLAPGRGEEAVSVLEKAREIDGEFLTTLWLLGLAYGTTGRTAESVAVLEKASAVSGRSPFYLGALAWGYGTAGRRAEAEAVIGEMQARAREEFVAPGFLAWAFAALGETDQAFEWLERSCAEHDAHLSLLLDMPFYDNVRGDRRFAEVRRKVLGPLDDEAPDPAATS
jgi:serine/threonine protein kinase/tetratricopeptide (TPR) repeat protein